MLVEEDLGITHPFKKQIDNCTSGDTIYVFTGTYAENVDTKLTKTILMGENRETTFIEGQSTDPVLRIGNSDTTVKGFTLKGSSDEIILQVATLCEDICIEDNIMENGIQGISLPIPTSRIKLLHQRRQIVKISKLLANS